MHLSYIVNSNEEIKNVTFSRRLISDATGREHRVADYRAFRESTAAVALHCGFRPKNTRRHVACDDSIENRNYSLFSYFSCIYFINILRKLTWIIFARIKNQTDQKNKIYFNVEINSFWITIIKIFRDFYKLKFGCKIDKNNYFLFNLKIFCKINNVYMLHNTRNIDKN